MPRYKGVKRYELPLTIKVKDLPVAAKLLELRKRLPAHEEGK